MTSRIVSLLIAAALALLLAGPAQAADLTVAVKDGAGHPVADAAATLDAPAPAPPRPAKFTINQKNTMFVPFVLVVPVGSTIDFANLDPFRHHVYSFSPAKKFELKLFGQGEVRSVKFDKPGVVAIGCNIHDSMQAFVQVVATPFAAKSGPDGRIVLRGIPAGNYKLTVWHPRLRAPANQLTLPVDTTRVATVPVAGKLRQAAPMQMNY